MAGLKGRRWPSPSQWMGEVSSSRGRRAERRADTPEEALELAERRLATSLQKQGPDSWAAINAMEAVAKFREQLGRYTDALALRQDVLARRSAQLGADHRLTLAAEARLAVTFLELKRPGEAKPLLAHVVEGLTAAQGPNDPTVLAATERLADAELALGEFPAAGRTLEEVVAHYEQTGDELSAATAATTLAKALIRDGRHAEACDQLRKVVDIRSRHLGTDDPETLAALRNLASSLVWNGDYAEASIVARNVHTALVRTHGPEHADSLDAERLVAEIDRRLTTD
jgi:tetratricopeptide (TPR) repeat protein